jgi:hypothetical protein
MNKLHSLWNANYTFTQDIAKALININAVHAVVECLLLPPAAEAELRRCALYPLLPKLISGEVDVSELNIHIGAQET